jgi:glycine/D-amino acid oxidase-like deaminating enzyme
MTTVSINPLIYLPYLQRELLALGAAFVHRPISHIRDAFALTSPSPSVVVNATGLLASKLGGVKDKKLYPTRGQAILVTNNCSKMYAWSLSQTEPGETWSYIIPRAFGGGTILGGCRQSHNWYIATFIPHTF